MPRIHVIGAPGSGKTTYARRLAAARKLPLCHLDEIYAIFCKNAPFLLHRIMQYIQFTFLIFGDRL